MSRSCFDPQSGSSPRFEVQVPFSRISSNLDYDISNYFFSCYFTAGMDDRLFDGMSGSSCKRASCFRKELNFK